MSKRFTVPNISSLCINYRTGLEYAIKNNSDIKKYISSNYYYIHQKVSPFLFMHKYIFKNKNSNDWIITLMKMEPINCYNTKWPSQESLLKMHDSQVKFAEKVLPIVNKFNFDDTKTIQELTDKYGLFLTLCLKNQTKPIVPTLIEDFMWHSHMTDNPNYVRMTKYMFGRILPHHAHIESPKIIEESQNIRKKFIEENPNHIQTAAMIGLGYVIGSNMQNINSTNTQEPKKSQETGSNSDLSDCSGMDITNPIHPLNPLNPLNSVYHHHHHTSSSYSSDSSCSSSSCSSSSCGSSD